MKIAIIENPTETDLTTMLVRAQTNYLQADLRRKEAFTNAMRAIQFASVGEATEAEVQDARDAREYAELRVKCELAECLSLARSLAEAFPSPANAAQRNAIEALAASRGVSLQ